MITAIEAGYISAVFVKDLSRLGRNYIEVGKLTEEFFTEHDVRLIAVSDGVDSDEGDNEFTPFRNIMNDNLTESMTRKTAVQTIRNRKSHIPMTGQSSTSECGSFYRRSELLSVFFCKAGDRQIGEMTVVIRVEIWRFSRF